MKTLGLWAYVETVESVDIFSEEYEKLHDYKVFAMGKFSTYDKKVSTSFWWFSKQKNVDNVDNYF